MNDPNGLIRVDGIYHLFYQHNPGDTEWGNIHWGHATSTDLLSWSHQPVAIAPDHLGEIFSGTVVSDEANSAGFGTDALVAVFTHDLKRLQRQSIAYSLDRGLSWELFDDNPVIPNPGDTLDFRDPKVFRRGGSWVMALAVGRQIWFFESGDLTAWEHVSRLTLDLPPGLEIIEVPDLIQMRVKDTTDDAWLLIVSLMPEHGESGPRSTWYATGDFSGSSFELDGGLRRLDQSEHLYAPMVWDLGPTERPVLVGWLDDRAVSSDRGHPWRGRLSTPRRLELRRSSDGRLVVHQQPLVEATRRNPDITTIELDDAVCVEVNVDDDVGSRCVEVETDSGRSILRAEWDPECGMTTCLFGKAVTTTDDERSRSPVQVVVDHGAIEVFASGGAAVATQVSDARSLRISWK